MKFLLDTKSGVPFYRQIIQQIEYNIGVGAIKPGYKLPTVRSLAIELKINPNTVAKAYSELEIRGIVITQVGCGTFVSDKKIEVDELENKKKLEEFALEIIKRAKLLNLKKNDVIKLLNDYNEDN